MISGRMSRLRVSDILLKIMLKLGPGGVITDIDRNFEFCVILWFFNCLPTLCAHVNGHPAWKGKCASD